MQKWGKASRNIEGLIGILVHDCAAGFRDCDKTPSAPLLAPVVRANDRGKPETRGLGRRIRTARLVAFVGADQSLRAQSAATPIYTAFNF